MQAIITKFLSPTNTRGARVKAFCAAGSVTVGFHGNDGIGGHNAPFDHAARTLRDQIGWTEANGYAPMYRGSCPDNAAYANVYVVGAASEKL